MRTSERILLILLLCDAAAWAGGAPIAGRMPKNPQVVCVYNQAGVSDRVLRDAEAYTSSVFRQLSVNLLWADCADKDAGLNGCGNSVLDLMLYVHIIPRALTLSQDTFGLAFLGPDGGGRYADAFFDSIRRLQQDQSAATLSEVLGHVMAHEIGHLLLGLNAHSSTGIMQARWSAAELRSMAMGRLVFNEGERNKLLSRIKVQNQDEHQLTKMRATF